MTLWRVEIEHAARIAGVSADLIEAIARKESSLQRYAWNPEPRYRYLWDVAQGRPFRRLTSDEAAAKVPPRDFPAPRGVDPDAEWWGQQASWGLLQVMGAVARERGFRGAFLAELTDPQVNLRIGCVVVRDLLLWSDGNIHQALAAYNGGRGGWQTAAPQAYATRVLQILAEVPGA